MKNKTPNITIIPIGEKQKPSPLLTLENILKADELVATHRKDLTYCPIITNYDEKLGIQDRCGIIATERLDIKTAVDGKEVVKSHFICHECTVELDKKGRLEWLPF